jgi:D-alanine-D-alanine ligase
VTSLDDLREDLSDRRVAVLLGGVSGERVVSLRSGANVLAALARQRIGSFAVDPRRDGWLEELADGHPDAVFLALHGRGGEDGTMQGLLETLGLRYTGSKVLASAIAMNKVVAKQVLAAAGLPTPPYVEIASGEDIAEQANTIASALGGPVVVKPTCEGSSLGVTIVREASELGDTIVKTVMDYRTVFAEKYIPGMEVTVGLLGTGRNLRALPVLELVPVNEFYDYEAKYTDGKTLFYLPARLDSRTTALVQDIALRAHRAVGCHGYSRVDMRVTPEGEPFITELNTLPGLTDLSDLPAQAKAAGISYDELVLEILNSAFVEQM